MMNSMGWEAAAALNVVIAVCYVLISSLIGQGLVRTGQFRSNVLAVATSAIFMTCAMHHAHHAAHLMGTFGGQQQTSDDLAAVRLTFGEWHTLALDAVGAIVALTYLALRRNYRALLNTPSMFDDAVRRAAELKLRELAFTDLLTGIPNRAAYQKHADQLAESDIDVTVLFIDLDGFKSVNDCYGHEVGDRVLREVAQRLEANARPGELVFRLGGDELVVVASDIGCDDDLTSRLATLISQPIAIRDGHTSVGASIGMSRGNSRDGVDRLLRQADEAMYTVKKSRAVHLPIPREGQPLHILG